MIVRGRRFAAGRAIAPPAPRERERERGRNRGRERKTEKEQTKWKLFLFACDFRLHSRLHDQLKVAS